ncbi:hypothetical protein FA04_32905 (plasmid) [Ensifer adhaerens]|uniref:SnoaL-like domain-containing protein n=1 Tax=Ensifer adhaerens TaxID=106592 RepID=A0ABY8HRG8_ENSAD|nr:DUF6634 family protein [Ensifer adhaerens]ANK77431.1 hypothetical protein FA04_32905 [Ensifer adhaerens]KDP73009.1 hypothetical protein FA04_14515 [Ensifer adhaerens]WFP94698.1 hypothetical protein P4B07_33405 [Ensifer adhaerens]
MPHTFTDADTLARLAHDIRQASSEKFTPTLLANAPILDEFALVYSSALGLSGIVSGHPRISDGHRCVTTQVFYLDVEQGVARTVNRWYRLGRPHGAEGQ